MINFLKNKKGQIDTEVFLNPAFMILLAFALIPTIMGYLWAKKSGMASLSFINLIIIILGEIIAVYIYTLKMFE